MPSLRPRFAGLPTSICIIASFILGLPALGRAQVVSPDPNYTVSLFAHGLQLPDGMVWRSATNDLLYSSENLGLIYRVGISTGAVSVFADTTQFATSTRPGIVIGWLALNSEGQVFVGLADFGPVRRFDSGGAFLGRVEIGSNYGGGALAFGSQDNLYVVVGSPGTTHPGTTIVRFAKGSFSSPTVYASGFGSLQDIRFNVADQLIAVDGGGGKVWQVKPGGMTASAHTLLASGFGARVDDLAIDPLSQDVYVGDESGKLTHITAPGVFTTFAIGLSTGNSAGMGFDASGNLYVGDKFVGVVWKFTRRIASTKLEVQPNHGGKAGTVTGNVTGAGFQSGATVRLAGLGADIIGSNVPCHHRPQSPGNVRLG